MSWADVERAIHAAVTEATGWSCAYENPEALPPKLPGEYPDGSRVIWAHQNVQRPATSPYVVLAISGVSVVGMDSVRSLTTVGRPDGQEIEHRVEGLREMRLSIGIYEADTVGDESATAIALRIQARMRLPTAMSHLATAGLSMFDEGAIRSLADLSKTLFQGRAQIEPRFYWRATQSEYGGYIAAVEITNATTGQTFDVDTR